jgi:hypothetical protein
MPLLTLIVVTNADHVSGEFKKHSFIRFYGRLECIALSRRRAARQQAGDKSSGIVFAGAKFSSATRVEAKDCLLHCFDITAGNAEQVYFYDGDKVMDVNPLSKNPSEYIMITDCIGRWSRG